ncbi:helix-turn-helix domain-containing protein [Nocardioides limicola]|uniref:helix-turn-helix domain-containing protein n=1 Tax=Nocardioides limicola TaxID=2803368 RepID=UPI00193C53E5|nr:helix-turn-helix transcriptional regulator [Nocardioides sp. DJM-14]
MRGSALVRVALLAIAGATGLVLTARPGVDSFASSPVIAAGLAAGAVLTGLVAARSAAGRLTALLWWGAAMLAFYQLLLASAGPVYASWPGEPWAHALVRLAFAAHIPPMTIAALAALAVRRALHEGSRRRPGRGLSITIVVLAMASAGTFLAAAEPFPPFERAAGPIGGGWLVPAGLVLNLGWLASFAAPAIVHLADLRRAGREPGDRRKRHAVAATGACLPVAQVLACGLLGVAAASSGLGEDAAAVVLIAGLGLMWPLTATALALAVRDTGTAAEYSVTLRVLSRALALALGAVIVLVAATIAVTLLLTWPALGGLGAALVAGVVVVALQPLVRRLGDGVSGVPSGGPVGAAEDEGPPAEPVQLGIVPPPKDGSPIDALSTREREVLGLVADGLSNAGIAAQLVLSTRTVEAHLRSVFTKLDLPDGRGDNRRVLAALVWHSGQLSARGSHDQDADMRRPGAS